MAQRMAVRRIPTEEVQGEDSFIVASMVTLEDWDEVDKKQKKGEPYVVAMRDVMARRVLDWNWVDDDGKPLPKPKGNPSVFAKLTGPEIEVVERAISGRKAEERKNSPTGSASPSGPEGEAGHQPSTPDSSSAATSTTADPAS